MWIKIGHVNLYSFPADKNRVSEGFGRYIRKLLTHFAIPVAFFYLINVFFYLWNISKHQMKIFPSFNSFKMSNKMHLVPKLQINGIFLPSHTCTYNNVVKFSFKRVFFEAWDALFECLMVILSIQINRFKLWVLNGIL